ncbi:MAG: hypothetical protein ACK4GU_10760 [Alishewanella aestuarii]
MSVVPDSGRLSFALITLADADLLYQVDQDEEVMRYITARQQDLGSGKSGGWTIRPILVGS